MKILALETSGTSGSVALWTGNPESEPALWTLPADVRSARSLAPVIERALAEFGWRPLDVELVAVTTGPGSFTGLRVGVATAKTFAYAVGCPAVGVNTLEVIARQGLHANRTPITVAMDAQRGELFSATWNITPVETRTLLIESAPTAIIAADVWLSALHAGRWVSGPGLQRLMERLPQQVQIVDANCWAPMATTVAIAGFDAFRTRQDSSSFEPFLLAPQYFRRTAAEEQWEHRRKRMDSNSP